MKINSIVRRLCPLETERLMGFPDHYLAINGTETPDSPQYKGCGNSQSTNCTEWLSIRMERVLREMGMAQNDRTIQYGTVCSGVEAQSLGCRNLNWHANFFSEIEPFPCKVLATRYPDVPNMGDLSKMSVKGYSVDVFCGGFPCQDYSVAGKRQGGMEGTGTRSSLAFHASRICDECLRDGGLFLYENVPGIYSSNDGKDFTWYIHRMNEEGFSVAWRTLDTQWISTATHPRAIPQRRRRMWMVCFKGNDWRVPARILFERSSRLGTLHPQRIVDGRVIQSEEDETEAALDLFGGATPDFNADSRADWISFSDMPGHGSDFLTLSDISLIDFFRKVGTIGYCGSIFDGNPIVENISARLRENIGNAGCAVGGRIVTLKMPEWSAGIQLPDNVPCPKEYEGWVCGLSDVLLPMSDDLLGYILSARACTGILRRADKRGKKLPEPLKLALHEQIANWSCGVFGDAKAADDKDEAGEAEDGGEECETDEDGNPIVAGRQEV